MKLCRITLLVFALLGASLAVAVDESEPSPHDEPVWDEQVEVRGALGEAPSAPLGASSTVLDPAEKDGGASALTDLVADVAGVAQNGQGGLFQVFSIRGVSRQRVMSLVSGMRVTSERRAGVSTSFIDPTLMGSVEVLRGPATTLHGSGALGGVVQVLPRDFSGWSFGTGYDSDGDENYQVVGVGGEAWSLGFARRDAGDGEAADGTRLNSHFTTYSAVLRTAWGAGKLRYELLAIPTLSRDIGKANTDFPERTTEYPLERHQMVRLSVRSDNGWRLQVYVHPQDLETEVLDQEAVERSTVRNDTFDFGLRWEDARAIDGGPTVRWGVDGFGRRDVDATEVRETLGTPTVEPSVSRTLDGADESELGAWAAVRGEGGSTRWEVGTRFSWLDQSNGDGTDRDRTAWNGFAGLAHRFGERVELSGALSSGLRFASLSELYFSGTTGRGEVIGNPALQPERSLNAEVSARWLGRRLVLGAVVFRNRIEDYIERIETVPDVLTFANLTSGTIRGLELQAVARPAEGWSLSWGGHWIDGEDSAGTPLADTPADELYLGAVRRIGRWRAEARLTLRDGRSDFGSGEKPIPSAELLGAALRYRWPSGWEVALSGSNLLDETYFPAADRKAPPAAGRSFGLHVSWR